MSALSPAPMLDFRFAAAAEQLGHEIFLARKAAYDCTEQWAALTYEKRMVYIQRAASVLRAVAPAEVLSFEKSR